MLAHRRRGFVERSEDRTSLRGREDWGSWARHHVPNGRWSSLPCTFPNPDDDPLLVAAVRWTLPRLVDHQAHARLVAEYQAGYRRRPEGLREIKAAEAAAVQLLSTEKW
jgi:hypothetical protein